jgi:DNA-3-methyladenine glycosylase
MGDALEMKLWQSRGALAHARGLLGKHLVRRLPDGRIDARMITEVEAYDGERDLACHAARGRTARTEVLYAAGGVWYVYLCYGIHEMLNLVVGPEGWPSAVLIRGVEGAAGPGRLTKLLSIDRRLNSSPVAALSGLWIEDRGVVVPSRSVRSAPRIGVSYAGPIWAAKPWRFTFTPRASGMEKPIFAAGRGLRA